MAHSAFQSIKRIAMENAIAVPVFAALSGVMFFVPATVCIASIFVGLVTFIIGSDFRVQSKRLSAFGCIMMFAAIFAAVIRGWFG